MKTKKMKNQNKEQDFKIKNIELLTALKAWINYVKIANKVNINNSKVLFKLTFTLFAKLSLKLLEKNISNKDIKRIFKIQLEDYNNYSTEDYNKINQSYLKFLLTLEPFLEEETNQSKIEEDLINKIASMTGGYEA